MPEDIQTDSECVRVFYLSLCFQKDGLLHTACGTPNYVAPEVVTAGFSLTFWICSALTKYDGVSFVTTGDL